MGKPGYSSLSLSASSCSPSSAPSFLCFLLLFCFYPLSPASCSSHPVLFFFFSSAFSYCLLLPLPSPHPSPHPSPILRSNFSTNYPRLVLPTVHHRNIYVRKTKASLKSISQHPVFSMPITFDSSGTALNPVILLSFTSS